MKILSIALLLLCTFMVTEVDGIAYNGMNHGRIRKTYHNTQTGTTSRYKHQGVETHKQRKHSRKLAARYTSRYTPTTTTRYYKKTTYVRSGSTGSVYVYGYGGYGGVYYYNPSTVYIGSGVGGFICLCICVPIFVWICCLGARAEGHDGSFEEEVVVEEEVVEEVVEHKGGDDVNPNGVAYPDGVVPGQAPPSAPPGAYGGPPGYPAQPPVYGQQPYGAPPQYPPNQYGQQPYGQVYQ